MNGVDDAAEAPCGTDQHDIGIGARTVPVCVVIPHAFETELIGKFKVKGRAQILSSANVVGDFLDAGDAVRVGGDARRHMHVHAERRIGGCILETDRSWVLKIVDLSDQSLIGPGVLIVQKVSSLRDEVLAHGEHHSSELVVVVAEEERGVQAVLAVALVFLSMNIHVAHSSVRAVGASLSRVTDEASHDGFISRLGDLGHGRKLHVVLHILGRS
mmetsp:Transcript_34198/g.91229  ORF Transcript_34198/g.91229 Transcript_34198/m.91229 type:complete len:215 (+) Transcript_34198:1197-1841(+)